MNLLEQQLQELQAKKTKVDAYKGVLEEFKGSQILSNLGLNPASTEITEELTKFISSRVTALESGKEVTNFIKEESVTSFTEEEVTVLKTLVARTLERSSNTNPVEQKTHSAGAFSDEEEYETEVPPVRQQRTPRAPPKRQQNNDKISFAMANRHLDNKRCTVTTRNGSQVGGKIVGTDAPYLVVYTDTGHTINVPPEEVTVG